MKGNSQAAPRMSARRAYLEGPGRACLTEQHHSIQLRLDESVFKSVASFLADERFGMARRLRIKMTLLPGLVASLALSACHRAAPIHEDHSGDHGRVTEPAVADPGTPLSFLQGLYRVYDKDDGVIFHHPRDYYDPQLASFMERRETVKTDEDDPIGFNPICQCQDSSDVQEQIRILDETPDKASADVLMQTTDFAKTPIHYDLVKMDGHWRIHDITSNNTSLLAMFRKAWPAKAL